jgi:menaquinone-dependent protoporphyrinogen oxidase
MTTVLVAYGSRHGGNRGIADRIGDVLRGAGLDVRVTAAQEAGSITDVDAFVVGSGVYIGSWLKEPVEFVRRNAATLAERPVWFFSSGPLPGSSMEPQDHEAEQDPLTIALGPTEGPGSGGHKTVIELTELVHPKDHRVFLGMFDPNDPPKALSERLVRMSPMGKRALPPGDFREWDAIEAWAREIAATLVAEPVAV